MLCWRNAWRIAAASTSKFLTQVNCIKVFVFASCVDRILNGTKQYLLFFRPQPCKCVAFVVSLTMFLILWSTIAVHIQQNLLTTWGQGNKSHREIHLAEHSLRALHQKHLLSSRLKEKFLFSEPVLPFETNSSFDLLHTRRKQITKLVALCKPFIAGYLANKLGAKSPSLVLCIVLTEPARLNSCKYLS